MENHQEEIKAHLMATSEEFRALAAQHSQLHKELEELEAKGHLNAEEQMEEVRLKKQKLRLKDQMNAMLARPRPQQVA
ncbi:MAG TPA: YdcH family protein [Bryobacteraceae bacterium]|nr:YdcH family protein [Bryobacteraceae bacterium]